MIPIVVAAGFLLAAFRPAQVAVGAVVASEWVEAWKNKKKVEAYKEAMKEGHNPFRQQAEAERAASAWARCGGVGPPPENPVGSVQTFHLTSEVIEDLRQSIIDEGKEVEDAAVVAFAIREYMLNDEEIFLLLSYVEHLLKGITPSESWWWLAQVSDERLRKHREAESRKTAT